MYIAPRDSRYAYARKLTNCVNYMRRYYKYILTEADGGRNFRSPRENAVISAIKILFV